MTLMDRQSHSSNPRESSTSRVLPELAAVTAAFAASRLLVFGTIFLSRLEIIRGPLWQPGKWFEVLTGGDAATYLALARNIGSLGSSQHDPTISFFPVFPLFSWLAALVLQDAALAGVLLANVCLFGAGWLMYRLVQFEFGDEQVSRASVMFLMFSPGALFFSTATAESLLLVLAIAAVLAARTGRWVIAAACATLAAATMNLGALLIVPLLAEWILQGPEAAGSRPRLRWQQALALSGIPALFLAAVLIGNAQLSDPFALLRFAADAETAHARLLEISATFAGYRSFYEWAFGGTVAVALALCVAGFVMKLRASYVAFAALLLVAVAVSHDLEAPRTMAMAFPLAVTLALVARKLDWAYEAVLLTAAGLLAFLSVLVANGHWLT